MKTIGLLYDQRLDFGGVEQHLLGLVRCADAARYRFVIFSDTSDQFAERAHALGARVVAHKRWRITDWGAVSQLAHALLAEGIDLAHAHSPTAAAIGRLAARRMHLPALVTVHAPVTRYHGELRTLRAQVGRWVYIALDRWLNFTHPAPLIYVSQSVRDECVGQHLSPAQRSLVIPNGADLTKFACAEDKAALRQRLGAEEQAPVMIFIGRLSREKGVDVLVEAAGSLTQQGVDFNLWLVGEGEQRSALQAQVSHLGLDAQVRFWGALAEVGEVLCAADIFVLPSRAEAFSIALLEAMAAGLPCAVTDVGESADQIQASYGGLYVSPDDAGALAKNLRLLIESPDLRRQMGENARLHAAGFSMDKMVERVQKIYTTLLEQGI